MSAQISLRGMLRLIRVDTLHGDKYVGFLAGIPFVIWYMQLFNVRP